MATCDLVTISQKNIFQFTYYIKTFDLGTLLTYAICHLVTVFAETKGVTVSRDCTVLQKNNLPIYLCRPGMQAGLTLGFLAQSTGVLSLNNAKSLSKVVRLPKNGCLIISRISLRNTVVSLLSVQSWSPRTT